MFAVITDQVLFRRRCEIVAFIVSGAPLEPPIPIGTTLHPSELCRHVLVVNPLGFEPRACRLKVGRSKPAELRVQGGSEPEEAGPEPAPGALNPAPGRRDCVQMGEGDGRMVHDDLLLDRFSHILLQASGEGPARAAR